MPKEKYRYDFRIVINGEGTADSEKIANERINKLIDLFGAIETEKSLCLGWYGADPDIIEWENNTYTDYSGE